IMDQLPNEIIAHIARDLSDIRDLSRLARAARSLYNAMRTLIWTAPSFASSIAFDKFLTVAGQNPALGTLVREINLVCSPHHWDFVNDENIVQLSQVCPQIMHIDLEGCVNLKDRGVTALAENCSQLRSVGLSSCMRVTDEGILALAKHCRELRVLELCKLHHVTDVSLAEVAANCRSLESLDIAGTRVSDETVALFIANAHSLTHLDLSSCYGVAELDRFIQEKPARLEIVVDSLGPGDADW
ncbi:hypothetical protein BC832DRAFT_526603, partial [Gaertneriomyces semiglobifer]